MMDLNRNDLEEAARHGLLSEQQAGQLWAFLAERSKDTPSFRFTHILYYLGGALAIGAMSLFMTLGWERFGGWGLFFLALAYAGAGLWLAEFLLHRSRLPIPAGIVATFVVALTPLAVYGLLMTLLAFWVDIRARGERDYAFWLYLFGVLAFWGGLSMMRSDSEWSKFAYLCINLAMIAVGAVLSRRVFAVFGGLGAAGYLGHLAYDVFKDSMLFPFALTAIGLAVIGLGIVWQRREAAITLRLRRLLPLPLRELVERRS